MWHGGSSGAAQALHALHEERLLRVLLREGALVAATNRKDDDG